MGRSEVLSLIIDFSGALLDERETLNTPIEFPINEASVSGSNTLFCFT